MKRKPLFHQSFLSCCLSSVLLFLPSIVSAQDWRENLTNMARNESVTVEAMFSQDVSFWVSVQDDGSSRDGLADYFCLLTYDAGRPEGESIIISIWDAAAMARGEMERLGRARCG